MKIVRKVYHLYDRFLLDFLLEKVNEKEYDDM
jgi:hypothetical protein